MALIDRSRVTNPIMEAFKSLVNTSHFARNPIVGGIPASLVRISTLSHSLCFENVSLFNDIIFVLLSSMTIKAKDAQ